MIQLDKNPQKEKIKKHISAIVEAAQKVEALGAVQILEKPDISETWIITKDGVHIRTICGHKSIKGPCLLPAGWGTDHKGKGKCKKHTRSLLYNPQLNKLEGIPERFGQLLEHVDTIEDGTLLNVDHEIKFLYAIQQYILTSSDSGMLSSAQLEALQNITMDIVKTKSIKNKIQKQLKLDASSVKEFVKNIFEIIVQRVPGAEAQNILRDIYNNVIVPYRNSDKITGSKFDFKAEIDKTIKNAESNV